MKKKIADTVRKHGLLICYLIFFASLIAYKIIFHVTPFFDWDESLYVQTGKEMFAHKYFLAPVWQGVPWFDKPPLIPFLYGLVMKVFFFALPEISTRLFTLAVACFVLILIYKLYLKAVQRPLIAVLTIMLTSLTPIFFQRSQVVNLDLFLLLGWVGYVLFFDRIWISTVFLLIAVLSKSLIGFYAPVLMLGFFILQFLLKKISAAQLKKNIRQISVQVGISLLWFILMFILYGKQFFFQQIIESHFRRITSSIEFHFGTRIYYLTLAYEQLGFFAVSAVLGFLMLSRQFLNKKSDLKKLFFSFYLLGWFVFLNLTKTKIFWYLYPAVPQLAFLSVIPLLLLEKHKILYYAGAAIVIILILRSAFLKNTYLTNSYSNYEDYYYMATYAKTRCLNLAMLLNPQKREAFATLDRLGLLITTTKWWGEHPSVVYYFGKHVDFLYDKNTLFDHVNSSKPGDCFSIEPQDIETSRLGKLNALKHFGVYNLFMNQNLPSTQ